jgi:hypothetical protein
MYYGNIPSLGITSLCIIRAVAKYHEMCANDKIPGRVRDPSEYADSLRNASDSHHIYVPCIGSFRQRYGCHAGVHYF